METNQLYFWTDESGICIRIDLRTDAHLVNILKWLVNDENFGTLKKDGISDVQWVKIISSELDRRRLENGRLNLPL